MAEENGKEKRVDRALRGFVDQLVARMEEASEDMTWKKPWIAGKSHYIGLPQNIKGNVYTGGQALLLQLHTMAKAYSMPIYMTYNQSKDLGVKINKGAKSTDVFKWGLRVFDKDTHKRIPEDVYRMMTKEEQEKYDVHPYLRSFVEFNIDQTNFKEVHPDRYEALQRKFHVEEDKVVRDTRGMYDNEALNRLIHEDGQWICPIIEEKGAQAAYSPGANRIKIPLKSDFNMHPGDAEETFKDGEAYYSTALHEMAHSTGHESQLGRPGVVQPDHFGSSQYAKEELVAELTAATVSNALGFDKRITENSAVYLKGWAASLKKEPRYIVSVMSEVNKAALIELEHIDEQRKALGEKPLLEGNLEGVEEKKQNQQDMEAAVSEALDTGKKEAQLLGLFGLPVQDTYYNEIELTEENSDGTVRDLYDKYELYNLFNDGENEKIMERMRAVREREHLTFDNTLPSSFRHALPMYDNLGEDRDYVYMLSPDDDKAFVMEAKVSKQELLHKYLPLHLDRDHLSAIGYDEKRIEDIMSLAGELGLTLEKPRKQDSETEDVAQTEENEEVSQIKNNNNMDEKNVAENPEKEVYYVAADTVASEYAEDFEAYRKNGNKAVMLNTARDWMRQYDISVEQHMVMQPSEVARERIVAEDDTMAVSYNEKSDSYDIMPKLTKEQILDNIRKNGLDSHASQVVKSIAYEDIARQFGEIKSMPVLTMPNGEDLSLQYNKDTNKIEVGYPTNVGLAVSHEFDYDTDQSLDDNLQIVNEDLSKMPEYQAKEEVISDDEEKKRAVAAELSSQISPQFTMPNGRVLDFAYDMGTNQVSFGVKRDGVMDVAHSYDFDLDKDVATNMTSFYRDLASRPEYTEQVASTVEVVDASKEKAQEQNDPRDEKKFYSSFAFMQMQEDTEEFEKLSQEGKYDEMLSLASEYDQDSDIDLDYIKEHAHTFQGDDLVTENEDYAVVYNGQQGGTFDLLKKVSENEIREKIEREGGLEYNHKPDYPKAVWDIQRNMIEEELDNTTDKTIKMPSGDVLSLSYNRDKDTIEIRDPKKGEEPIQTIMYSYDLPLDKNLSSAMGEMSDWPEYQEKNGEEISETSEQGLEAVSSNVYEDIARRFNALKPEPVMLMDNGEELHLRYNQETNKIEVCSPAGEGMVVRHELDYDTALPIYENLEIVDAELSKMPEYQKQETATKQMDSRDEKKFYSSFAFMQTQEDTEQLEKLREEGNHEEMLFLASEHVQNPRIDLDHVREEAVFNKGDEVIAENDDLAVVYNGENGGTYELLRKVSENDIREEIGRESELGHSHPNSPGFVFDIHREMVDEILEKNRKTDTQEVKPTETAEDGLKSEIERDRALHTSEAKDMENKFYYPVFSGTSSGQEEQYAKFTELREKGDIQGLLDYAKGQDDGRAFTQHGITRNLLDMSPGLEPERILAADSGHTLTVRASKDDVSYNVYRKVSREEIIRDLDKNGLAEDASHYVLSLDTVNKQEKAIPKMGDYVASLKDANDSLSGDFSKLPKDSKSYNRLVENQRMEKEHDYFVKHPSEYDWQDRAELFAELATAGLALSAAIKEDVEKYKRLASVKEDKVQGQEKPAHEDSNIRTNVVADAKRIADSGVPMEKAEKIAKSIADGMAHEDMHREEAEQAKRQEQQEKEDAQRKEEEKKQQEAKKEEKKDNSSLLYSGLLLTALAHAKENDGVWMNGGYRQNASVMFRERTIEGFNNVMMNLHAEQNGFKTNAYTLYNAAKENGFPVKAGQASLPFSWTFWTYVNQSDENVTLTPKQYAQLSKEDKMLYTLRSDRKSLSMFNVDQTTYPARASESYKQMLKDMGDNVEVLETESKDNVYRKYSQMSRSHPDSVVLMNEDGVTKSYQASAVKVGEALGIKPGKAEYKGKDVDYVEFPANRLDDLLPRIIRNKNRVIFCDPKAPTLFFKQDLDANAIIDKANYTARVVTKTDGIKLERVMVYQDAQYSEASNTLTVSGMSNPGKGKQAAAVEKANDIYRKLVEVTGTEARLDRHGRNHLTPIDDRKYDKLVQELVSGIMMAKQGLPATISKENMSLIPYWETEIKENPKMMGIIERDVNQAAEAIRYLSDGIKVDYNKMRGVLPDKEFQKREDYKVIAALNKYPSMEGKEFVLIKDKTLSQASVILPKGASLKVDNEVSGMRKDRIETILRKEGIQKVSFYNPGGSLGLKEKNGYFKDKEVSLVKLKQYTFEKRQPIDVKPIIQKYEPKKFENFKMLRNDDGRYFFFIKPEGEKGFCVQPQKVIINGMFEAIKRKDPAYQAKYENNCAEKFYKIVTDHPDARKDFITPRKVDVDYGRIRWANISQAGDDKNNHVVTACIDGVVREEKITKPQWDKMWLSDDMDGYKRGVAAIVFEKELKKDVAQEQELGFKQSESEVKSEGQGSSDSLGESEENGQAATNAPSNVRDDAEDNGKSKDVSETTAPQRVSGGMHR